MLIKLQCRGMISNVVFITYEYDNNCLQEGFVGKTSEIFLKT